MSYAGKECIDSGLRLISSHSIRDCESYERLCGSGGCSHCINCRVSIVSELSNASNTLPFCIRLLSVQLHCSFVPLLPTATLPYIKMLTAVHATVQLVARKSTAA